MSMPKLPNCLQAAVIIAFMVLAAACSSEPEPSPAPTSDGIKPSVPVVTLEHWRDSTPGERYAFLIGFVTMLEMEKEWQGQGGRELYPLKASLVGAWVEGFENLPLSDMYNGINAYIINNPGDLSRPVAEVMWFTFIQPRIDSKKADSGGEANAEPADAKESGPAEPADQNGDQAGTL